MAGNTDELKNYKPVNQKFAYKSFPFYWIARASNLYAQRMEKTLKKSSITITGWRILMVLKAHKSLSISELSEHCSFNPSRVTKTVYAMQGRGLLSVNQSKTDGRVSEVRITRKGLALVKQLTANTSKTIDIALEDVSEKELLLINALLQKLVANLADH